MEGEQITTYMSVWVTVANEQGVFWRAERSDDYSENQPCQDKETDGKEVNTRQGKDLPFVYDAASHKHS
jgi:hypothetical protein